MKIGIVQVSQIGNDWQTYSQFRRQEMRPNEYKAAVELVRAIDQARELQRVGRFTNANLRSVKEAVRNYLRIRKAR